MECDQCGARRPKTGRCPECGAPAPGTFSSMRQWKDQSRTGHSPAVGRGGSGANWGPGSSGSGRSRDSGADWRGGGGGWDDDAGYADAPSNSGRRRRRAEPDYAEMDIERAMVPAAGGQLMDAGSQAGLPAIPGIPQTEEEERAYGIRRPVYIPAVPGKRKRKLGTWRVISGVLSVIVVTIGLCGLGSVLLKDQITSATRGLVGRQITPVVFSTANIPATPVATPGAQGKYFVNVVTAQAVDVKLVPIGPTSRFTSGQTVYVVFRVQGLAKGTKHTVSIRWFLQGQYLPLQGTNNTSQSVNGDQQVYFSLFFPTAGLGMARLMLDAPANDLGDNPADPYLGATIYFGVFQATPSPSSSGTSGTGTSSPGNGTPSATAGKGTPSPTK
jgi:hypothetical protein